MKGLLKLAIFVLFITVIFKLVDHFYYKDRLWLDATRGAYTEYLLKKDAFLISKESDLSDDDVRRILRSQLNNTDNSLLVYLKNGKILKGVRESETEEVLVLKQMFGNSGSMITKIEKNKIESIDLRKADNFQITEREVIIKRELPDFNFFRNQEYSFFTDQDFFKVSSSIELLKRLRKDVFAVFSGVIDEGLDRRIYVIIFGDPNRFNLYRKKVAPKLGYASGFYDSLRNQLVLYDFFQTQAYIKMGNQLDAEQDKINQYKKELRRKSKKGRAHNKNIQNINKYEDSLSSFKKRNALLIKSQNIRVLRHEAAHQLSYDLGIIKGDNFDIWFSEGFAEFCSTSSIGKKEAKRIKILKEAIKNKKFIKLKDLISLSLKNRFNSLDSEKLSLAYLESWALFYYLMQPDLKFYFFNYINKLKDQTMPMGLKDRVRLLEVSFGMSIDELNRNLIWFIEGKQG